MKKTLLFGSILALAVSVNAQYFGLQAGGSLASMAYKTDLYSVNTHIKPAFFMGVAMDLPLNNNMVINTALNYKHAGTWIKDGKDVTAFRLNYINLDVTYNYLFTLSKITIFAEGGGYLGYAFSGKTIDRPENGDKIETDINFGSGEDEMKPLDAGIIIGAGIYFGRAKLGIDYIPGLINLSNVDGLIVRNYSIALKATYFFNRE
jgi:hypothetical protein